ncbi:MAG: hypothetical protein QW562_07890 [Thermosphaera sp.]
MRTPSRSSSASRIKCKKTTVNTADSETAGANTLHGERPPTPLKQHPQQYVS